MTQAGSGNIQGFPLWAGSKISDPATGQPTEFFSRFLLSLWFRAGKNFIANVNSAYIQQSPTGAGAPLEVHKSADGSLIGVIPVVDIPGQPAVPQVLGASPFIFPAPKDGTLIVESGKVEISRNGGGTW